MDPERLASLRTEYETAGLAEGDLSADPFAQFELWFRQAIEADLPEPNAMVLATTGAGSRPSVRTVLLKGLDRQGLVFYTNYRSRKGDELALNPWAAVLFLWVPLHRQVRIEGSVEMVPAAVSDEYFASRPRGAQLAAAISPQSEVVADRQWLEAQMAAIEVRLGDRPVPRPADWGGYLLRPTEFEFWQGRPNRLHDRLSYKMRNEAWVIERLAP